MRICQVIFCFKVIKQPLQNCKIISKNVSTFSVAASNRHYFLRTMATTENCKKQKTGLSIATHDGIFHCDEILACFMLQQLPEYAEASIVRTRDEDVIKTCDIVVDVGAIFDHKARRFDHHQKSFQHSLSSLRPELGDQWTIRLSSAGLIYAFFGEDVIKAIIKAKLDLKNVDEDVDFLRQVYVKVYKNFIQEIDAIDNGVSMYKDEPLYHITTNLSSRVGGFNSMWNSKEDFDAQQQFERAKELVGAEFIDKVLYYSSVWWPARSIVERAIKNRLSVHESGEILELEEACPWKEHLFELEKEHGIEGIAKYIVSASSPTDIRVIGVPLNVKSFVGRKFLHIDWRGTRNKELQEISGIGDANFVHASGFIGGSSTREGALQMAIKSLSGPSD